MALKRPRGTNDFLGDKVKLMTKLEETVRDVCKSFGINEIRTPMFEYTELFQRGVGETTDIVQKEMFTLKTEVAEVLHLNRRVQPVLQEHLSKMVFIQRLSLQSFSMLHHVSEMKDHRQDVISSSTSLV